MTSTRSDRDAIGRGCEGRAKRASRFRFGLCAIRSSIVLRLRLVSRHSATHAAANQQRRAVGVCGAGDEQGRGAAAVRANVKRSQFHFARAARQRNNTRNSVCVCGCKRAGSLNTKQTTFSRLPRRINENPLLRAMTKTRIGRAKTFHLRWTYCQERGQGEEGGRG